MLPSLDYHQELQHNHFGRLRQDKPGKSLSLITQLLCSPCFWAFSPHLRLFIKAVLSIRVYLRLCRAGHLAVPSSTRDVSSAFTMKAGHADQVQAVFAAKL